MKMSAELHEFFPNDFVLIYFNELSTRLVAKTGNPKDAYHLGKLILQSFRDEPNFVLQVDGTTNESITFKQAEEMTVRCAQAYRKMGLKKGDMIVIMSNNNIHLSIPYHAAAYEGIAVTALDRNLGVVELQNAFEVVKPKVVFSQSEKVVDIQSALKATHNEGEIITFDQGNLRTLDDLIRSSNDPIADYMPPDVDPEEDIAVVVPTSGTTGLPKFAAIPYKSLTLASLCLWVTERKFPYPTNRYMMISSVFQWVSAHMMLVSSPLVRVTRLTSYLPMTRQVACKIINKHKPSLTLFSPTLLATYLKPDDCGPIDFTCLEKIYVGGSAIYKEVLDSLRAVSPKTLVIPCYGSTECSCITISVSADKGVGQAFGWAQVQLVDMETQEVIRQPYKQGEMWVKCASSFKGYYNNPEATKALFSPDGWIKTGDILYQDEHRNYYFVERAKMLLKYKNEQVSPTEVESVILKHPSVFAVAVVGKPHLEYGDLITAFVVKKPGAKLSAQEVKDIVAKNLSLSKHLSGGVIFIDQLPMTPTQKVKMSELRDLVKVMQAE